MPVIDLKNTNIYFEDGTQKTGAVNNGAGYAAGVLTITVDGFTGIVPVGSRLSIDGDDRYQVVSTTETSTNTTSITFTPALAASILDDDVVIAYGVFLRIKVGDGTITWSEKKPREYKKDRGKLDQVRDGDEEPIDVTINLMYEELTASSGDPPTPEDVLKQRGEAADWISAETDDPCAPFAINIRLDHAPPNCTAVERERVILPRFRYESLDHNPKDGTVSCQGKCNATEAIVTRLPQLT
jgi:hypothetical protein